MSASASKRSLFGRIFAWILGPWQKPKPVAPVHLGASESAAFMVPLMVASKTETPLAPSSARPSAEADPVLPRRLAAVSRLNARSSLVAKRASPQAPAGKAIPKKTPKRLKPAMQAPRRPTLTPKLRVLKPGVRPPALIIELAEAKAAYARPAKQARAA